MPDVPYTVKFNRAEGAIEVAGPERAWVEEQVAALVSRLETMPAQPSPRTRAASKKGTDPKPPAAVKQRRSTRSSSNAGAAMDEDLAARLTEEVTDRLDAYMNERPAVRSAQEQAPVLAAFLGEELEMEDVSAAELSTVYKVMGWKIPGVDKALRNGMDRKQYFTRTNGRYRLTRHGLNYARVDSKATGGNNS